MKSEFVKRPSHDAHVSYAVDNIPYIYIQYIYIAYHVIRPINSMLLIYVINTSFCCTTIVTSEVLFILKQHAKANNLSFNITPILIWEIIFIIRQLMKNIEYGVGCDSFPSETQIIYVQC